MTLTESTMDDRDAGSLAVPDAGVVSLSTQLD